MQPDLESALNVILSDKKSYNTSLNYAIGYTRTAFALTGHALKVQLLYILNNISHWRHPEAKAVRETLRRHSK